jgi:hypothetical protein
MPATAAELCVTGFLNYSIPRVESHLSSGDRDMARNDDQARGGRYESLIRRTPEPRGTQELLVLISCPCIRPPHQQ